VSRFAQEAASTSQRCCVAALILQISMERARMFIMVADKQLDMQNGRYVIVE
jgi:hypothetical protein